MSNLENTFAPGSRIVVRDAEWLVRRVDRTSTGGQALSVVGISELVRDKEAVFLTEIDKHIEILDPEETRLVPDTSSAYQTSLLYMESLLRQKVPTADKLYIGHQAAMDPVPFQLDAAIQALQQPRQRILIADAVGLGKTLPGGPRERTIVYEAPFDRCDREEDYETAWTAFKQRGVQQG